MTNTELVLDCKTRELKALEESKEFGPHGQNYFQGKAEAYAEIWELLITDGKLFTPAEYAI